MEVEIIQCFVEELRKQAGPVGLLKRLAEKRPYAGAARAGRRPFKATTFMERRAAMEKASAAVDVQFSESTSTRPKKPWEAPGKNGEEYVGLKEEDRRGIDKIAGGIHPVTMRAFKEQLMEGKES